MKTEQKRWTKETGWKSLTDAGLAKKAQLVIVFGGVDVVADKARFDEVRAMYPEANVLFCSTAGEIIGNIVSDGTLALTAVSFAKTRLSFAETDIGGAEESEAAGRRLAEQLPKDDLAHAMVFSDGLQVNGTALVKGLLAGLPSTVSVTGGLVGGGNAFAHTYVGLDKPPQEKKIVLVGFHGKDLRVGYGSLGGWDPFGPERLITRSKDNILYELDGEPALDLYKKYLGDQAAGLPGTGLLFPLELRMPDDGGERRVVRTLLGIDDRAKSMTFAGDMPQGVYARLMKANFDRLVDGAEGAAGLSIDGLGAAKPELAVLVSCIGRKLVLKERIEDEVEAVIRKVGSAAAIIGFYSYGEICPTAPTERQCQMHNQTMTITVFREV